VLSEFGVDSIQEERPAEILSQKLSSSFEMGAAGTVVFPGRTSFTGGFAIQDWALA